MKPKRKPSIRTKVEARGWQGRFLKALADIPNISHALKKARVTASSAYVWRDRHPEFKKAWEEALQAGIDSIEEVAMQRVKNGVRKGVWMKDARGRIQRVETIAEYPEGLTQFLLKAHRPKVYREPKADFNLSTTTTAPDGTVTEFAVHVSKDELP